MLNIANLCKSFGALRVTDNISMRLEKGERRVIVGPNGAGKTTLFNLIAGILRPSSGNIIMDNIDITNMPIYRRAQYGLARSYQRNTLFTELTVGENISLAVAASLNLSSSLWRDTQKLPEIRQRVSEIAAEVGLEAHLNLEVANAPYGNKRQLEIAVALASHPKLLLMDEPTSGIGPDSVKNFHQLLKNLPRNLTLLIVEHDMDLAFDIADSITVLNYGKIIFEGSPDEVKNSPLVNEIYLGEWDNA